LPVSFLGRTNLPSRRRFVSPRARNGIKHCRTGQQLVVFVRTAKSRRNVG
jgi:hypothetical protein